MEISPDDTVTRSYFEPGPVEVERDAGPVRVHARGIGEVFTDLGRAGFRVDTLLEPGPDTPGAKVPSTIVWRARKEGA